ncbi:YciI family protein [Nitrospirillum sp. BR 11828]|uniref:YciI family protein n=1 Tax=Nitrospirillum sp. BR 11828 TaxID=3104325 RepID=UPI002ACA905B|nr:YciI family protein [Nitrospirillum sp. BR 11828]MDZ5646453.1 YciI family protein [Nitrospirillum sp. BR 11828]
MHFAITCTDKPGHLDLRLATRPRHLEYLDGQVDHIVVAGPLLDAEGKPTGSLLVVDFPDEAAAQAFAAADPYAEAGLFASVTIQPFRVVYPKA